MPHSPSPVKVLLEAKYRVTFVDYHTQDVADCQDLPERYMLKLLGGGTIGYPKSTVIKVEPLSTAPSATAS